MDIIIFLTLALTFIGCAAQIAERPVTITKSVLKLLLVALLIVFLAILFNPKPITTTSILCEVFKHCPVPVTKNIDEDEKRLRDAKAITQQLKEQIKKAKEKGDLEEIKLAKDSVQKAIKNLQRISENSPIAKDVKIVLNDYQEKLGDFDRQIEKGCVESIIGACVSKKD